jgi:hypothetical protein
MRLRYDEYLAVVAMTLARRHRPVWSWQAWSRVCSCGSELPCRATHKIPIRREHWPSQEEQ